MAAQGNLLSFAREVIDVPVDEELGESFLAYSLSVITSRAIPDVRDGLKPVQRRILYSMREMRLFPERPHRKCAHVVGGVMAKFHPHGDSAIYDTLVRLGQDFAKQVTVIDPQGNFGSLDDPPAAYRYTECRLTPAAIDLLADIDEETVEWRPTYDGETLEPVYLPGALPNLLVNGTSGIAVGMATNMAPHNLREVHEAIKLVMTKRRPKPTIEELMAVIPGPDFPSGGRIINEGLQEAAETGRGSAKVRAKAKIVKITRARQGIEISELPYLVGVERVISKIKQLRDNGKINEISDVKNLTDRTSGLRLVIECKTGVNPELLLEKLYKFTPLEESFSINNVVLVNGVPTTVGLYDLCLYYIQHRLDVIVRRTSYRLKKAQERLHLVEGLLIAIDNIDRVIAIIRSSANSGAARQQLMDELSLSEIQAEYVLELKLRRLTALAYEELVEEKQELVTTIAKLEAILGSESRQRTIVLKELDEIVKKYGVPRRSLLIEKKDLVLDSSAQESITTKIPDLPCTVSLTASGLLSREAENSSATYTPSKHDVLLCKKSSSTAKVLYAISTKGRVFQIRTIDIPEKGGRSRGKPTTEVLPLERGEKVISLFSDEDTTVLLLTALGKGKRLEGEILTSLASAKPVIKLAANDELVAALAVSEDDELVAVSLDGQTLRTAVNTISIQGAGAQGVAVMKLKGNARIRGAGLAHQNAVIITVTETGTAKSTAIEEVPLKGRATTGVRIAKFKDEKYIAYAWIGNPERAMCIVGKPDAPNKPDTKPQPLQLRPTRRDTVCKETAHRILTVGSLRW